ncbi:MAG: bifunctional [glutamate--ammonia ligase]-adenylyl-L-tyrosine phosphorylase/[glutamate--ammonia-ligase] adenylyltransferase, partial [Xanthomonadales bacterium]|nr:bifunctional [glutamate--ammonia ligase]-adenylyl-L-tyrosine phosphorylase/[glutamate--ammonia-ligase] adenylyltransferase [Xanthomonadales bacterium]
MTDLATQRLAELDRSALPLEDPEFEAGLRSLLAFSEYAFDMVRRYPEAIAADWRDGLFARELAETPLAIDLDAAGSDEARAMAELRRARHRALFRILWRDVNGIVDIIQALAEQSLLAEQLTAAALRLAKARLANFGTPRDGDGKALDLVIFGLGKLGGRELNFSSDIDLVYACAGPGETDGARHITAEQYFMKLGTQVSQLLSRVTEDGFCYRVDLRLRPFGDAGRLVLSANAMEQYFQREGRQWERYAWIKARTIAGDHEAGSEILAMLRPFVYRRYLDFGAFESLREMKAMIRAQVERRELVDHIKLGRGGIREIEFFAQAHQLIRGGREPSLRNRSLLATLDALVELGDVPADQAEQLVTAYAFMRRLENRFQQVRDDQTHQPPAATAVRDAIAGSLGFDDWAALEEVWQAHRDYVADAFNAVFADPDVEQAQISDRWSQLWVDPASSEEPATEIIEAFKSGTAVRALGQRSRGRLDRLMPRVLADLEPGEDSTTLRRILDVIASISRRSTYLTMLTEQDEVRGHLIKLCAASPWLAHKLAAHPLMLDELLARRRTVAASSPLEHLQRRLGTAEGDLELEMEILREVRDSRRIGLAAGFLDGAQDIQAVAQGLSEVADALLQSIYELAWRDLVDRHGQPGGDDPAFAVIGYGTLGGRELLIESDLDLVFLYSGAEEGQTAGPRSVSNAQFFTRLSQRILHLLTTQTASGRLFDVDTRLRPNGRGGLLVSSMAAFETYQKAEAWTWEQQALTRARWVAGSPKLRDPFDTVRREVLCQNRDTEKLAQDVVEMRDKMRAELDRSDDEWFDLKQGRGGRVDLEFLSQYARLRWSGEHPELLEPRGTAETFRVLGELDLCERAGRLIDAYYALQRASLGAALANRNP